jgi:hypothetical protein
MPKITLLLLSNSIYYCNHCGSKVNLANLKNADTTISNYDIDEVKYDKVSSKSSYPRAQGKK